MNWFLAHSEFYMFELSRTHREISTDLFDKHLRIKHAKAKKNGQTSNDRRIYIAWMDNIK